MPFPQIALSYGGEILIPTSASDVSELTLYIPYQIKLAECE
jgi:hypothetical protein